MSVVINEENTLAPEPQLHLLPFHVSYSGKARIPNYFVVKETDEKTFDGIQYPENELSLLWSTTCPNDMDLFRVWVCVRECI
jgi:hypothetical protein